MKRSDWMPSVKRLLEIVPKDLTGDDIRHVNRLKNLIREADTETISSTKIHRQADVSRSRGIAI